MRLAVLVVVAAAALVLVWAAVWAYPRATPDLFVALAGGQEVAGGQLGQPDTWSFATAQRVWINQNWGSHLGLYLVNRTWGPAGLLAAKAVLVALLAAGLVLAARQRGATWPISVLTAAIVLLAARREIDLRPNLVTLILAPWLFWLLLRSSGQRHLAWAAAAVIGVWANLHGGFTFGLGMLALWMLCQCLFAWRSGGLPALVRCWPLPAATAAAFALAGLANPFGPRNLTESLVVGRSSIWRMVVDWQSIFHAGFPGLRQYWEFIALVLVTAGLAAARLWAGRKARLVGGGRGGSSRAESIRIASSGEAAAPSSRAALVLFEILLVAIVVYMGCSAQRFTPLAMILLGPLLAVNLEWLLQPARRLWPAAATGLLVVAATAYEAGRLVDHYSPVNPAAEPETFFQRMIVENEVEPVRLAQFINANDIGGRIFQEWPWEGYLHLKCPQLSLWVGARAQQVYTEEEYRQEWLVSHHPAQYAGVLEARGIHLIAISRNLAQDILPALALGPQGTWAVVYFDGSNFLLADCRSASTAALVEKALAAHLQWPSDAIAALSRAMCMECTPNRANADFSQRRALLHQAIELQANPIQVQLLVNLAMRRDGTLEEPDAQFLAGQYNRWSALSEPRPHGWMIVDMCREMAEALTAHHRAAGRLAEARDWADKAGQMQRLAAQMKQRWVMRERMAG
jgi:hypothetical protein